MCRAKLLAEMEALASWTRPLVVIGPHYLKAVQSRPPHPMACPGDGANSQGQAVVFRDQATSEPIDLA